MVLLSIQSAWFYERDFDDRLSTNDSLKGQLIPVSLNKSVNTNEWKDYYSFPFIFKYVCLY